MTHDNEDPWRRPMYPNYAVPQPPPKSTPESTPKPVRRNDDAFWSTLLTAVGVTGLLIATGLLLLS